MAEFTTMINRDYNIKRKPITVRNPQSNAIVERVHQTLGNMLQTFDIPAENFMQEEIPGILAAIAFGICSTIHTTMKATPMQVVFGRDSIMNIQHLADWRYIQSRKQDLINLNNKKENKTRKEHTYAVDDRVLVKQDQMTKYGTTQYRGPYTVIKVNNNGTVWIRMGNIFNTYNIRQIKPYH